MKKSPLLWLFLTLISPELIRANTIVVDTAINEFHTPSLANGGKISLREAIRDAGQSGATICFAPALSGATINLNQGALSITSPQGSPGGTIVIDGTTVERPIKLTYENSSTSSATLTVSNRNVTVKGLVVTRQKKNVAAISATDSALRLEDVSLASETGEPLLVVRGSLVATGCEIYEGIGVQLLTLESLRMEDSSIYHMRGPGIKLTAGTGAGTVLFRNCTIAENLHSPNVPGALQISGAFASVQIDHCSFVDNATAGLSSPSTTFLSNSLFARNLDLEGNLVSIVESSGVGATSSGYNLSDDDPAALSAVTDTVNTDTKVSRIGYFGGERKCCFPLAGSPAIDGGNANRGALVPGADGRGFFRNASSAFVPNSNPVDIGAVETNPHGSIMVTTSADSGAGSLRAAITSAIGQSGTDTHHIIIATALSGQVLDLQSLIFVETNHNINIDGSALATPLKITGDLTQSLFVFSSSPGDFFVSGSLTSLTIDDYSVSSGTNPRAAISVSGGCRFGFQRLIIEDCRPVIHGALDVFDSSEVYIDECFFQRNRQLSGSSAAPGGSAISVRQAIVEVWNSSFVYNRSDLGISADGGAVRVDKDSEANFRLTTFALNEAKQFGGAIHYDENGVEFAKGRLVRCTFFKNEAQQGAVSAPSFTNLQFSTCVFSKNVNLTDATPATVDLYPGSSIGNTVLGYDVNWTDATATSRNLATVGLSIELAPTALYSGVVPTSPFVVGWIPASPLVNHFTPRDAIAEAGLAQDLNGLNRVILAGAVQRAVAATDVLKLSGFELNGNNFKLDATGVSGIQWRLETSLDLENWSATSLIFQGGTSHFSVAVPSPQPDRFFVRFKELR